MKQTSDHMNREKAAGTMGAGASAPRKESAPNASPSTNSPSGSSQGHDRGKQGQ